jgi:methionyl-tRNA synthetase
LINKGKYEGWYCESDENFVLEKDLSQDIDGSYVTNEGK